jgi:hypothetical protein
MPFRCTRHRPEIAFVVMAFGATACETVAPYQPPVETIRIEDEAAARWRQVPPLDPRIGPEEVIAPITNHAAALVVVRRRVPAHVPAPCPALADDAVLALPTERWLFGVRTWDGREVLPCHFGLVLSSHNGTVRAFHRYPDTAHDTWLPAEWAHAFAASGKHYVSVNTRHSPWFDGMPLGVTLEPGLPRAKVELRYHSVPGDQGVHLGDRRWPWHLSQQGHAADGTSGSDLYASFLRHDDGVLFGARAADGKRWAVWRLDTASLAVEVLPEARYVYAWPPPPAYGWRERRQHDREGAWGDVKAYVTRPSPHDPSLLWLRRTTGAFAPPPDTAGVVPLVAHATTYESVTALTGWAGHEDRPVPVRHATRVEQFLVAYDLPGGRRWGVASHDFTRVSGPRFAQVLLRPSPALTQRVAYRGEDLGACHWVLAQRASDGAWAIGYGHVPDDAAFRTGIEPDALLAEAERTTEAELAPLVANAKLAKVLDEALTAARAAAAARRQEEQRAEAQRVYDQAMAYGSNFQGWNAATQLGGKALFDFAMRLGTLAQCEQVVGRLDQDARQHEHLTARIAALRQQKEADEAAAAAAQRAANTGGGGGGGGGGTDWSGWRRETMNAQSANQLGLTGEAFSNYMQRHR